MVKASSNFIPTDENKRGLKELEFISLELTDNFTKAKLNLGDETHEFNVERRKNDFMINFTAYTGRAPLGSIKAVYRNLRENYEYRLRYDEAGKFFIREMELKRKYREVTPSSKLSERSIDSPGLESEAKSDQEILPRVKENGWLRKNIFTLTAWYYHLSRYGEDLIRPTVTGIVIILLSTFFWMSGYDHSFFSTPINGMNASSLMTVNETPPQNILNHTQITNLAYWQKSFARSFADFMPLIPFGENYKVGLLDYIIKIFGGILTFGLIAIALRRRFERKYTR